MDKNKFDLTSLKRELKLKLEGKRHKEIIFKHTLYLTLKGLHKNYFASPVLKFTATNNGFVTANLIFKNVLERKDTLSADAKIYLNKCSDIGKPIINNKDIIFAYMDEELDSNEAIIDFFDSAIKEINSLDFIQRVNHLLFKYILRY